MGHSSPPAGEESPGTIRGHRSNPVIERRYLEIVAAVDSEFERNRLLHGDRIHCRAGCTDCCHHLFQITEIEAARIAKGVRHLTPQARDALRERARAYLEASAHLPSTGARLACPALDGGVCSIYDDRPLTCHKFGMPLYNPDKPDRIYACELNFKDGEEIEDPDLIQIQTGIHRDWKQLQVEYGDTRKQSAARTLNVARAILEDRAP